MRSHSGLMLAATVAIAIAIIAPPAQARDVLTCEGWKDCFDLRAGYKSGDGAYGQISYPDGSIWGVCVL